MRAGVFKDVDVVLFAHVGAQPRASAGATASSNGLVSVEYTFKGESAHAAGAPWRGKSALDAVELMDVGWNFRREHLRLQQRSHYVITNGGDQPNVVPPTASRLVLLPRDRLRRTSRRCGDIGDDDGARRAAMMTDTDGRPRACSARRGPAHFNKPIAEAMYENIKTVGTADVDRGRSDAGARRCSRS